MSNFKKILLTAAILAGPTACTWVTLDQQAVAVRLMPASAVADCKRIGSTTSTTKATIGPFERGRRKVQTELLTLARNSAASMGGNALTENGPMKNGKQTFTVYKCDRQGEAGSQ